MKHVHIEMIGGLAGDMFLAAALDAGLVEQEELESVLSQVGLGTIRVHREKVVRRGIRATHIHFSGWDPEHERDHRHLTEIEAMIASSSLEDSVKERATQLFRTLGEVEAHIHDTTLDHVHFHECGAVDSILDFVGAAWVIEQLAAQWSMSAIPRGEGTIQTEHGLMPALAPATAALVEGYRLAPRPVQGELVTPTGAAILRELEPASVEPAGTLVAQGYGAGTRDFEGLANVVRLSISQLDEHTSASWEDVVRLICEVDDQSPEELAWASEALLAQGALDVVRSSVTMKKGRLATQLAVLCRPDQVEVLTQALFEQTSTFGVRHERLQRAVLHRHHETVETPWGDVRVKVGSWRGEVMEIAPEYEDCAELAREHGVSIREVFAAARSEARQLGLRGDVE